MACSVGFDCECSSSPIPNFPMTLIYASVTVMVERIMPIQQV